MSLEITSKSDGIIAYITEGIRSEKFVSGNPIPSISQTAEKFGVAKKTVVRSYNKLKKQGLIESRPKKGFFVINRKPSTKLKLLLVIQSFDGHWEVLYNSFRQQVHDYCDVEVYFHHYNINMLDMIVARNVSDYDLFVISSFNHPRIKSIIGRIPAHRVLIISRNDRLDNYYNSIIQDFYQGTFFALNSAAHRIRKYKKFILSFPEKGWHSPTLKQGFVQFCHESGIPGESVNSIKDIEIKKNHVYLVINDHDLIHLLGVCKKRNWEVGKDLGIISYNETPVKEIIHNGISVISCNFISMARQMADFIKERKSIRSLVPIEFISRNSV